MNQNFFGKVIDKPKLFWYNKSVEKTCAERRKGLKVNIMLKLKSVNTICASTRLHICVYDEYSKKHGFKELVEYFDVDFTAPHPLNNVSKLNRLEVNNPHVILIGTDTVNGKSAIYITCAYKLTK